jgi:hypothetical protein
MAVAYSLAVRPAGGDRTWTVVDASYATVGPVEEWLEAHRYLWSPNTVRGYATSLAQWWSFLEQRGEAGQWQEAGVPAVAGFLSWLRNGRTVEHALAAPGEVPSAETLHARLAALISFYQWQEAVHSVPVAGRLLRGRGPDALAGAARAPGRAARAGRVVAGAGAPPPAWPASGAAAGRDPGDHGWLRGLGRGGRGLGGEPA